ncbi:DUF2303 family protein [uncultured Cohaesibacter sp.]|uniref:DUF2303 family protein n=1 Tax=uncultured Cohaesibacter sp. TaxID=1002546 RepID=UPI0029C6C7A7|nr:DUF2303 family protein [uncultured Cohaesibacter sp.]
MDTLSKEAIDRIAEMAGQNHPHEIVTIKHAESKRDITLLLTRDQQGGMISQDMTARLERYDAHPLRREGTAKLQTLDSLINHVNRFKNDESVLFAERIGENEVLKITGVIDYHDRVNIQNDKGNPTRAGETPQVKPQHCKHRATHTFPLSDEIKAWSKVAAQPLDLLEFALFLEDNILDVLPLPTFLTSDEKPKEDADIKLKDLIEKLDGTPCGPRKLMELSKGLQINEDTKAKVFINKDTGEQSIGFENEHEDAEGNKLVVPNMFLIAIPIFEGGEAYRIPVRLRYRKDRGSLAWLIEPYQLDRYIKHAFAEACERAAEETDLPLYFGQPEA